MIPGSDKALNNALQHARENVERGTWPTRTLDQFEILKGDGEKPPPVDYSKPPVKPPS